MDVILNAWMWLRWPALIFWLAFNAWCFWRLSRGQFSANNLLALLIVDGLIVGVVIGDWLYYMSEVEVTKDHWSYVAGNLLLIRPLKLLIVPIVFVSVLVGVTSIGNPSKLGVVGGSTVLYYVATMLISVTIGTTLVSTFQPGDISDEDRLALQERGQTEYQGSDVEALAQASEEDETTLGEVFLGLIDQLIPRNVISDMAEMNTLGIIVWSLMLGLALAAGGETTAPAVRFFEALFDGIMRLVMIVIWITPVGVALLMIYTVGSIGLVNLLGPISWYVFVVLLGLLIHGTVILPLILYLFTRQNPYRFMWQMRKALMTAFGTDSSSATLPVTIETAEREGGCSKRAANFVLPLGSTINMDGTALYEAVAVVFLFQLYGIDLQFDQLLVVVVTATLAAVGAAGVPSAGLVMMIIVITAVNKSLAGTDVPALPLAAIGVIIGIDRIVDMCRTTVNVWGDAVGAKIITRIAPDVEEEKAKALA